MLSKSSKLELGFVHYIGKFTRSRFVISRFECIPLIWYFSPNFTDKRQECGPKMIVKSLKTSWKNATSVTGLYFISSPKIQICISTNESSNVQLMFYEKGKLLLWNPVEETKDTQWSGWRSLMECELWVFFPLYLIRLRHTYSNHSEQKKMGGKSAKKCEWLE